MSRNALLFRLFISSAFVPLVVGAIGIAIMLSWLPGIPGSVIVHWGLDGNRQGEAWFYPLAVGIIVVAISALISGLLARAVHPGAPSVYEIVLAVVPLWISIFITGSAVVLLGAQRNGPSEIGHPWVGALASLGIAAAASGGAWLLLPRPKAVVKTAEGPEAKPLPIEPGQRTVWMGQVSVRPGVTVLATVLISLLLVFGIFTIVEGRPFGWVIVPLSIVLGFGLSTFDIHMTIDRRGLVVRGAIGVPTIRIPLDDVARVGVVTVNGLVDTGGYGTRFTPGRRTIVMIRSGEAIEVLRKSGRTLVVTIDDAQGAAGVLAALFAQPVK